MTATPHAFDVIVIGAGPAGEVVAGRCADADLRVAIVERELVGGECSYWGCMPSKALLRPGDVIAAARRVPGARAAVTGAIDVDAALAFRDAMAHGWDDEAQLPWLGKKGIELVRGVGRLAGEKVVEVEGSSGDRRRLTATTAVVLATGTRASVPPVDGLREARPWDNRTITAAKEIPRRLVVLGGGPIGAELAQAFHRLGSSEVTVIEGEARLLPREEPFAGDDLRRAFEAEGIGVRTGTKLTAARRAGPAGADGPDGPVTAVLDDGSAVVGDELLVAVGRQPATSDLGLDAVGLEPGEPVAVDDHLRARDVEGGWLYAVGDCNGRALLTHMGKYQARIAAGTITGHTGQGAVDVADDGIVPRITFTDPQVAAVGLTEQQARDRDLAVRIRRFPIGDVAGSAVRGEGVEGTAQLVIDGDREVIVGATFTGPDVQELLHSATIAIAGQVPLERLWHAVPAYPTVSEVWLRLFEVDDR